MNRRTNVVEGCVKFPTSSTEYKSSKEGGMYVRLVVYPLEDYEPACCGGYNFFYEDEELLQDSVFPFPVPPADVRDSIESCNAYDGAYEEVRSTIFPGNHESRQVLAAVTLGWTGWSGWNDERCEYWTCKYEDLTDDGKALYDNLSKLFEGRGAVALQTWLDT